MLFEGVINVITSLRDSSPKLDQQSENNNQTVKTNNQEVEEFEKHEKNMEDYEYQLRHGNKKNNTNIETEGSESKAAMCFVDVDADGVTDGENLENNNNQVIMPSAPPALPFLSYNGITKFIRNLGGTYFDDYQEQLELSKNDPGGEINLDALKNILLNGIADTQKSPLEETYRILPYVFNSDMPNDMKKELFNSLLSNDNLPNYKDLKIEYDKKLRLLIQSADIQSPTILIELMNSFTEKRKDLISPTLYFDYLLQLAKYDNKDTRIAKIIKQGINSTDVMDLLSNLIQYHNSFELKKLVGDNFDSFIKLLNLLNNDNVTIMLNKSFDKKNKFAIISLLGVELYDKSLLSNYFNSCKKKS